MSEENNLGMGVVHSAELSNLYTAIGKACANFPDLPRTATGQVGKDRKFKYAPYHKVVQCIKGPLAEQGVGFVQPIHSEDNDYMSMSLIVYGHGANIASKIRFKKNDNVKDFGADVTYHKRYQLTCFFGLEGDPDADDFESPSAETSANVSKTVQSKPEPAKVTKAEVVENKVQGQVENVAVTATASPQAKEVQKDTRSIGQKLTDAMKQLNWQMSNFDEFCKKYPEEFPDFISAAKLPPDGKLKLYEMLVVKGLIAPF